MASDQMIQHAIPCFVNKKKPKLGNKKEVKEVAKTYTSFFYYVIVWSQMVFTALKFDIIVAQQ